MPINVNPVAVGDPTREIDYDQIYNNLEFVRARQKNQTKFQEGTTSAIGANILVGAGAVAITNLLALPVLDTFSAWQLTGLCDAQRASNVSSSFSSFVDVVGGTPLGASNVTGQFNYDGSFANKLHINKASIFVSINAGIAVTFRLSMARNAGGGTINVSRAWLLAIRTQ